MQQKKKILLSHSGKQHSYYVARALNDLGYLRTFYTSSYIGNISAQKLIQKLDLTFFSRRFLDGLGGNKVHSSWKYEIKELVYRRLKGNTQAVSQLVYDRDVKFDKDLAGKLHRLHFDAFWGFQGSSRECIDKANELGKESICEMTIAHVPFAKRLLLEEAKLHPEWAESIDFVSFPAHYEMRLIEEPLLAKKVIAISSFLKKTLVEEGVTSEKISVIPLGFDANSVSFEKENESINNRPLRVLYAGRITQRKGIKYLLDAIKCFNKKDVELHIIGNVYGKGQEFEKYKDLYQYTPGISQLQLYKQYKDYDVLVFPSLLEGFGLVTIEAMGAGLPVITTANTNASEVLRHGLNGYLVPIRDSQAIVDAITRIRNMDNPEFQRMRQLARLTALQYTWDVHKEKVLTFLNSI
ncbi:hypothetical protein A4H97_03115 [Niastella yeongjuensis]|uniref:Glycosyl transferase family 1 domain-containing protein n=1 Tax=Niastella yeongjuensis TaxID=354355 RepID=A0A1V9EXI8_9BACT|nr:glycosyltransferase family 4 protein [Niastella yeongjuensis]OQP50830.1 hypothetical protein A4H97_03115 [Niastella yeongjuensis]SEN15685.1 Glycosyltransferase involved in cell wall bisynthesis [Niastella yeongjuensis]